MKKGTVQIKNIEAYYSALKELSYKEASKLKSELRDTVTKYHPEIRRGTAQYWSMPIMQAIDNLLELSGGWASYPETETPEYKWPKQLKERISSYRRFFSFANEFDQEIQVAEWNPEYALLFMGNPERGVLVIEPDKYLKFLPATDYSETSPMQLQAALIGDKNEATVTEIIPAGEKMTITAREVKEHLTTAEKELAQMSQELDNISQAKTGELAEMKAEIEAMKAKMQAKKEELLAQLREKMDEMEAKKEALENQIYLLDSQIFAIRCYAGETVRFAKIRSGIPAPVTTPVVIHQKLRFLDEELGKLASLYTIQWNELNLFEEFLRSSPIALETFAPNERCIVLIRLSRTGKEIGRDYSEKNAYRNLLRDYEYYHGKTVGIIIRNGENLYLGWTDDDYVKIDDDFVNNIVDISEEQPKSFVFESDRKEFEKRKKEKRKKAMTDILSRVFVTNILQGIVDHSDLLPMPAGVRFDKPSEFIRYAVADTWLDDGRFGDFTKIIEKCNETVIAGDMLLTVQRLVPEHDRGWGSNSWASADRPWENSRGRGEANRTHDCSVSDCTLYPANLVEYDEPVKMVRYRFRMPALDTRDQDAVNWQYSEVQERYWEGPEEGETKEFVLSYEKRERHVFVSVKKEENWRRYGLAYEREPRSNFELYDDEYINLTYMNSVWLGWVITQRKLGGWRIGGKEVDYAYAIKYLKTAMDYIRQREEKEKALIDTIDPAICQDAEWPLKLSEWKLKKGVRAITAYQAKRFVKAVQAEK